MWAISDGQNQMSQQLYSISDTIRAIGLGRTSIYNLINEGRLTTVKLGRRTLIKVSSVEALIRECQVSNDAR